MCMLWAYTVQCTQLMKTTYLMKKKPNFSTHGAVRHSRIMCIQFVSGDLTSLSVEFVSSSFKSRHNDMKLLPVGIHLVSNGHSNVQNEWVIFLVIELYSKEKPKVNHLKMPFLAKNCNKLFKEMVLHRVLRLPLIARYSLLFRIALRTIENS